MKTSCVVGVDPGLDGALAFLAVGSDEARTHPMPTRPGPKGRDVDCVRFSELLAGRKPVLAVVELVHSMPQNGHVGAFKFGKGYGQVLAVLELLRLPVQHVTPQAWKKAVLAGLGSDKLAAARYCQDRFRAACLHAGPKSGKPHDGVCDALCLAEFGRRLVLGRK